MKTMLKIAAAVVGACLLPYLLFVAFLTTQAWYYQSHIGHPLETELGFTQGSPSVRFGDTKRKQFVIQSVQPGGVFERAGFHSGDIVVGMNPTILYRRLHNGRGRDITVHVADGGDGPVLNKRRISQIRFRVPEKP